MAHCAAFGCTNGRRKPECIGKSFFSFPLSNKDQLKTWLIKIKRENFAPTKHSVLCSDHFDEDCFRYQNFTNTRLLKPGAIPTNFIFSKCTPTRQSNRSNVAERNAEEDNENVEPLRNETLEVIPNALNETNSKACQTEGFEEILDELVFLRKLVEDMKKNLSQLKFTPENIEKTEQFKAITGFVKDKFYSLYKFINIEEDLIKNGKLSEIDQFFLFMLKLRTGITNEFLSILFRVSDSTVSRYFNSTAHILYKKLLLLNIWPSKSLVQAHMPRQIRVENRNCRVIIDCTEFFVQKPANPAEQQLTFSHYKNSNTLKSMIGITPSGAISFVSELYCGSISDKELFLRSGMLEKLEPGDMVMADKGFRIEEELKTKGCFLKTPTFLKDSIQFSVFERENNNMLSNNRVHVERAIGRIKYFKYFEGDLPYMSLHNANEVFFIAAVLVNFGPPLIQ